MGGSNRFYVSACGVFFAKTAGYPPAFFEKCKKYVLGNTAGAQRIDGVLQNRKKVQTAMQSWLVQNSMAFALGLVVLRLSEFQWDSPSGWVAFGSIKLAIGGGSLISLLVAGCNIQIDIGPLLPVGVVAWPLDPSNPLDQSFPISIGRRPEYWGA
jgi:hypothetical protein